MQSYPLHSYHKEEKKKNDNDLKEQRVTSSEGEFGQRSQQPKHQHQKKFYNNLKDNSINLFRILRAEQNQDEEVMRLTTLMIRNIPVRFMQNDMLKLIDKNFYGKYNYFYLPMDLRTHQSVGFAFINMTHPLFILDFFLEFNYMKWSDAMPEC